MQVSSPPPWSELVLDMNADGRLSVSDLGALSIHVFFLPGDCLLWLLFTYSPGLVSFFELSYDSFGGVESAVLSTAGWLLVILVLGALHSMVVRLNWAMTALVGDAYRELLRRTRVGKLLLAYRVRGWTQAPRRVEPEICELSVEVDLSDIDLQVLRLHGPGNARLGVGEIADRVGVSVREAQGTIDKLKKLQLLVNRMDEKASYQLTRPGQMFLVSRNLLPA